MKNKFFNKINLVLLKSKSWLQKNFQRYSQTIKPFLAPKYWGIYLICFVFGFYFLGPYQGGRRIANWWEKRTSNTPQARVKSLEQELAALKKNIRAAQTVNSIKENFNPDEFVRPGAGEVIQGFDWRKISGSWRLHSGVDLALAPGSNVLAAASGAVNKIERNLDGSFVVTLNHGNEWQSIYSGLKTVTVNNGQKVLPGVILGLSGKINCLPNRNGFHFGIHYQGKPIDPGKLIEGLVREKK